MLLMLLPGLALATSFETKIKVDDGHSVYRGNVNGQTVEVETDGQTEINSSFENGEFEVSVGSEGSGEVKAEGEGNYEIESNDQKETGSGTFSRFYEYLEGFIFKLTVISGFM